MSFSVWEPTRTISLNNKPNQRETKLLALKAKATKSKDKQTGPHRIRRFCSAKEKAATEWEEMFGTTYLTRGDVQSV